MVYTDGTFEFLGVLPGRYTVVTLDNPGRERSVGASIVAGNQKYKVWSSKRLLLSRWLRGVPRSQDRLKMWARVPGSACYDSRSRC